MARKERNLVRRRLIRSYVTSVISISLVLTLMGAAAIFWASAGSVSRYFKENVTVSLILPMETDDAAAQSLVAELSVREDVKSAEYISRERGADELKMMLGADFLEVFETNPVPASIDLHLAGEAVSRDSLSRLRAAFEADPRIREVVYQESLIESLNANLGRITLILTAVIALLLVISFALINNTVRLNIYARRFTIHTMHLVGARNAFISRPFIRQALVQGAVSGLIAAGILGLLLLYVRRSSELIYSLFNGTVVWLTLAGLVLVGMLICALSAAFVVNRLAYTSKDDLYY